MISKIFVYLSFLLLFQKPIDVYNYGIDKIEQSEVSCYEKTLEINDLNKFFLNNYKKNIKDKKITCIGDSITNGNGGSLKEDGTHFSYCDYLSEITNREVVNLGIGGAPIGDYWDESSLILRWEDIPQDSDFIIIFAGINDYFIGEYGDIYAKESKTFCGDTYQLFTNIKNNYKNSKIYIVLTYQNESQYWEQFKENDFGKYMNTLKLYAQELDLNIIDLTNSNFLNSNFLNSNDTNIKENFIPDGIHPNDNGNKLLAERIAISLCLDN